MSQGLQFFTPFSRTFDGPLDVSLVFDTTADMNNYLLNPARYPGQIVACKQEEGKIFVLSNSKNSWLLASGNQEVADKHLVYVINHKTEEIIEHNLGKKPAVQIFTNDGDLCIADVQHIDINTTKINFNNTFSGKVTFN
jgi:hypothetical protein